MATTNYYMVNGRIRGESTNGVRTTYGTDALGSVTGTYDQNGNPQNTYLWAPYGTLIQKTGTATDPKFGWNGSSGYRNTGRNYSGFYVRRRHFDSTAAQWTSVDGLWPSQPSFAYAGTSPATQIDASGFGGPYCDLRPTGVILTAPLMPTGYSFPIWATIYFYVLPGWSTDEYSKIVNFYEYVGTTLGQNQLPPPEHTGWNSQSDVDPDLLQLWQDQYWVTQKVACSNGYGFFWYHFLIDRPVVNSPIQQNGSLCVCQRLVVTNSAFGGGTLEGADSWYYNFDGVIDTTSQAAVKGAKACVQTCSKQATP